MRTMHHLQTGNSDTSLRMPSLIDDQKGVVLLGLLIFIFFIGLIVLSLLKLLTAEATLQVIDINKKRAFYAAQSGIEYAMRSINEYALQNSTLYGVNHYSEKLETGPGTHCVVSIQITGPKSFKITSVGYSQNFAKTIEKEINYIDVAKYAVYATGKVKYLRTIPYGKVYAHAKYMPLFDRDYLIELAKPKHYYPNDLYINSIFSFNKNLIYVGRDLTFGVFNWINTGNFAVGRHVKIKSSFGLFGATFGTIYQFNPHSTFLCQWQFLWRALQGGIITNGDVYGTNIPWRSFRFTVFYNRTRITRLLRYSVNGGPLIYTTGVWRLH